MPKSHILAIIEQLNIIMIKQVSVLILALLSFAGFSQVNPINEEVSERIDGNLEQFLAEEDGFLYVLTITKRDDWVIEKIDCKTKEVTLEWPIEKFKISGEKPFFVKAMVSQKGFHLVFAGINRGKKLAYLSELTVSWSGDVGALREIAVAQGVEFKDEIHATISENEKVLCITAFSEEEGKPKFFIFDNYLRMEWEGVYRNGFDAPFNITSVEVSNEAEVWMVGYRHKGKNRWYEVKPSADYAIVKMNGEDQVRNIDLKEKGKVFHSLKVRPDLKPEAVVVTGFFADNLEAAPDGVYFAVVDEANLERKLENIMYLSEVSNGEFDQEFDLFRSYLGSHSKKGLTSFKCKDFAVLEGGNMCVVAERDYISKQYNGSLTHNVDEIIVLNFDDKGRVLWVNLLPKKQELINNNASYFFYKEADNIRLFYSNDVRNAESISDGRGAEYTTAGGKNYGLLAVQINSDGKMKVQGFPNKGKDYYYPKTPYSFDRSNSIIIMHKRLGRDDLKLVEYTF